VLTNFNQAVIECEKENEFIYKFFGTMQLDPVAEPFALDVDQVLLRGSSLRNTDWIYGIAIYTGHDSKVMMNSSKNKAKFSKIEIKTNQYIILGIIVQTIVCIISTIFNSIWSIYL
jgi:magnesium-transporting ATPase (P-type)